MSYKFSDLQLKWLAALESGEFKQIQGALVNENGHCCLGVACAVAGITRTSLGYDDDDGAGQREFTLPESLTEKLRLRSNSGELAHPYLEKKYLIELNDEKRLSFREIATFIRENPESVFKDQSGENPSELHTNN